MSPAKRKPWYHGGLQFECQRCGQCCGGEPGIVWVKRDEARAMAQYLGISAPEFYDRYTRKVGFRVSLNERPNGDCVMLREGQCTIYPVRPIQCKTFPFWPWNLDSPLDWEALAKRCPGINKGRLYSYEEIEEQRRK